MRPRRGGLLRIRLALAFRCLVFCGIRRGATTGGKSRRGPRRRSRRSPPRASVGGMGGVGMLGGRGWGGVQGTSRRRHPERRSAERKKGATSARLRRRDETGITSEPVL